MASTPLQLDYSDFYRFRVSLGVGLVLASVALPFFWYQADFGLALSQEELGLLSSEAQRFAASQRRFAVIGSLLIPFVTPVLFGLGLVEAVAGLQEWSKRQAATDQTEELLRREAELRVRELERRTDEIPPDEVSRQVAEELAQSGEVEDVWLPGSPGDVSVAVEREYRLADRLRACLEGRYEILTHRRLREAEYDIILSALSPSSPDVVIEVKHIRKGFGSGWVRDMVHAQSLGLQVFIGVTQRPVRGVLVILSSREILNRPREAAAIAAKTSPDVSVAAFAIEELGSVECDTLLREVGFSRLTA